MPFEEFSILELQEVLQLRSKVFVVEQNAVYLDIDGKDEKALHVLGLFNNKIVAYCRLFNKGDYFDTASIGRVVIDKEYRDKKWGHDLMRTAIAGITNYFSEQKITISAQAYLKNFYESHGFIQQGGGYFEDGIPHIKMVRA